MSNTGRVKYILRFNEVSVQIIMLYAVASSCDLFVSRLQFQVRIL